MIIFTWIVSFAKIIKHFLCPFLLVRRILPFWCKHFKLENIFKVSRLAGIVRTFFKNILILIIYSYLLIIVLDFLWMDFWNFEIVHFKFDVTLNNDPNAMILYNIQSTCESFDSEFRIQNTKALRCVFNVESFYTPQLSVGTSRELW